MNGSEDMSSSETRKSRAAKNDGDTAAVILPLPEAVIAQIKSSTAITTLNGAVLGLVQNSLDAGADKISIDVDFARGNCIIEDNGCGIIPAEFEIDGGLGRSYHTSKHARSCESYGAQGTFIASLSAICLLIVTSKHEQHRSTNTLIMYQSKVASRLMPAPAVHHLAYREHGTKVTIRDIFGNMPVRVKQRAILLKDQGALGKLWGELRSSLIALLIGYAAFVSLQVNDVSTGKRCVLGTASSDTRMSAQNEETRSLASQHRLALSILVKSGKIGLDTLSTWIPAAANSRSVTIQGLISLKPVATKSIQYILLNRTPLPRAAHNALYDQVDRLFSASRFGANEAVGNSDGKQSLQQTAGQFKGEGLTIKQTLLDKGADRWPMFVLRIYLNDRSIPNTQMLGIECDLTMVIKVLDTLVSGWLETNHFRPRKRSVMRPIELGTDVKQHTLPRGDWGNQTVTSLPFNSDIHRPGSLFASSRHSQDDRTQPQRGLGTLDGHSRIRSSYGLPFQRNKIIDRRPTSAPAVPGYLASSKQPTTGIPDQPGVVTDAALRNPIGSDQASATDVQGTLADTSRLSNKMNSEHMIDEYVHWTDPITRQTRKINARIGAAVQPQSRRTTREATEKRVSISQSEPAGQIVPCVKLTWLDQVLSQWNNPVFQSQDTGVVQASFEIPTLDSYNTRKDFLDSREIDQAFAEVSHLNATRISKQALAEATVLGQVDTKFILAVLPSSEVGDSARASSLLVIIDQHAADERCHIEQLLEELCQPASDGDIVRTSQFGYRSGIRTTVLSKSIRFSFSAEEADLLQRHASYFASWGILYQTLPKEVDVEEVIVEVKNLPPTIAERCRLEPKLLISLLRSELWTREDNGQSLQSRPPTIRGEGRNTSHHLSAQNWLSSISDCPRQLLEMLNSRACRSAIMFNDVLTVEESENLIKRLSTCAFPFQCAHGRPSMVPLIDLGNLNLGSAYDALGSGYGGRETVISKAETKQDFAHAYRAWQQVKVLR